MIMTKEQIIQKWLESYGLKAFEENSVPTGDNAPPYPYITYEFQSADFQNRVSLTFNLWYRSTSWAEISDMTNVISIDLTGGKTLCFDNTDCEQVFITKGTPFVQNMPDESDDTVKRKLFNVEVEYFTIR